MDSLDIYTTTAFKKLQADVAAKDVEIASLRARLDKIDKAVREQGYRRVPVPATPLRSQADALAFDMSVPCGRDHYDIRDDFEKLLNALTHHREAAKALADYATHEERCVRRTRHAGEPTPDGGYREKFGDKWYQSRPVDETPKCDCGLDEAYALYEAALTAPQAPEEAR